MRRLVELDNERRDVVLRLCDDYRAALTDVIDVLEIVSWNTDEAKAALAAGLPSGSNSMNDDRD